jgi:hypothetical protein
VAWRKGTDGEPRSPDDREVELSEPVPQMPLIEEVQWGTRPRTHVLLYDRGDPPKRLKVPNELDSPGVGEVREVAL